MTKLYAHVLEKPAQVIQFKGFLSAAGQIIDKIPLKPPDILFIATDIDGVFLYRFTTDGECVGDTWHVTVDDAKEQAEFEYKGRISDWNEASDHLDLSLILDYVVKRTRLD